MPNFTCLFTVPVYPQNAVQRASNYREIRAKYLTCTCFQGGIDSGKFLLRKFAYVMNSQIAPLPWEQHLPQVVFCHNGASARLVASHGASFATVYVACSCPTCETRPLASFRTGGCVLGLGDWALHVGLKAASLAEIQVIQSKAGEKVGSSYVRGHCIFSWLAKGMDSFDRI